MRSNVKTIKLTAWSSLILVAITYLISTKGVWGAHDLKWLPDTFLLAVFGGAFASMLVVLICEISKYFENRENTESYIFSHLYYLYGRLQIINKNIDFLVTHKEHIHKDALSQLIINSEAEMNTIYYADYAPYKRNNAVLAEKNYYNNVLFPIIQCFLQNCKLFEIAVLTDAISINERKIGISGGSDNNAYLVLMKLSEEIQAPLTAIDATLTRIDQLCHGRYNWQQIRDNLVKSMPDNRIDMLERFLEKK